MEAVDAGSGESFGADATRRNERARRHAGSAGAGLAQSLTHVAQPLLDSRQDGGLVTPGFKWGELRAQSCGSG